MKENSPSDEMRDAFLTGAAARAEHYEIAAYTGLVNQGTRARRARGGRPSAGEPPPGEGGLEEGGDDLEAPAQGVERERHVQERVAREVRVEISRLESGPNGLDSPFQSTKVAKSTPVTRTATLCTGTVPIARARGAVLGMAVDDEIRSMHADRTREPARAEERPDRLGLADDRLGDRGVVQEDDGL